jgi:hypothetical protein
MVATTTTGIARVAETAAESSSLDTTFDSSTFVSKLQETPVDQVVNAFSQNKIDEVRTRVSEKIKDRVPSGASIEVSAGSVAASANAEAINEIINLSEHGTFDVNHGVFNEIVARNFNHATSLTETNPALAPDNSPDNPVAASSGPQKSTKIPGVIGQPQADINSPLATDTAHPMEIANPFGDAQITSIFSPIAIHPGIKIPNSLDTLQEERWRALEPALRATAAANTININPAALMNPLAINTASTTEDKKKTSARNIDWGTINLAGPSSQLNDAA